MKIDEQLRELQGKKVIVAGAGISGISACRFLCSQKALVTLVDDADTDTILKRIQALGGLPSSVHIQSQLSSDLVQDAELIVLSPGIPQKHPTIQFALQHSVLVINEVDLAAAFLPNCRFVGITGTNGKSTTTTILGSIAKAFDTHAFVGGNLGIPLCEILLSGPTPQIAILELSSYQLELLAFIKLDAAVVTNLTPDHLDRYRSVEDYYMAKAKIFDLLKPNGKAILNLKDPNSIQFLTPNSHPQINFNAAPHEMGISIQSNELHIRTASLETSLTLNPDQFLGKHNYENAAAALAAALALNIPLETIQNGLQAYAGIPHRLESLGQVNGVRWVNDSKATNVESAIIAVQTFPHGVHLIVGGLGKHSSYAPLVAQCRNRVKAVYAIGQDAPLLLEAFKNFQCFDAKTLEQATNLAQKNAKNGDTILLAPACASWDQFESFAHRGDLFRSLFKKAQQT